MTPKAPLEADLAKLPEAITQKPEAHRVDIVTVEKERTRYLTACGKINTTLGPDDFLETSVAFRIFHPRPSVSGGKFESDFGPKEMYVELNRPHVVF